MNPSSGVSIAVIALVFFLILFLSLTGCVSTPHLSSQWTAPQWTTILPGDCSVYFSVNFTARNRELVQSLLGKLDPEFFGNFGSPNPETAALINSTECIFGALRVLPPGDSSLYMIVAGQYPTALINLGFAGSSWKLETTPREYWVSLAEGVKICIPNSNVLLFSTGDVLPMIEGYYAQISLARPALLRDEVGRDMESAGLVAYFPDFEKGYFSESLGISIPIREIWAKAIETTLETKNEHEANGVTYALEGYFELEIERHAQLFDRVLRLILVYLLKRAGIEDLSSRLRELDISVQGSLIRVSGLSLTGPELSGLVSNLIDPEAGRKVE